MQMDEKKSFWESLVWIGAIIILGWVLLKIIGVISSPVWVEMLPYFGGGLSIIGAAYKLGKIKKGIEQTEEKVEKIIKIEERFNKIEHEHELAMNGKLNVKHNS